MTYSVCYFVNCTEELNVQRAWQVKLSLHSSAAAKPCSLIYHEPNIRLTPDHPVNSNLSILEPGKKTECSICSDLNLVV